MTLRVLIIADDLSGALEAAATGLPAIRHALVARNTHLALPDSTVVAVDTDTRSTQAIHARAAVGRVLNTRGAATATVVKKVDSLLRGNIAAELAAFHDAGLGVVFAPALPALGRTIRNGTLHIDGSPAADTPLGAHYLAPGSLTVASATHPLRSTRLDLAEVRGSQIALQQRLTELMADGAVACPDAETYDDLVRISRAARRIGARHRGRPTTVALAGSADLVRTVIDQLPSSETRGLSDAAGPVAPQDSEGGRTLIVSGSNAPAIGDQLAAFGQCPQLVLVDPQELVDDDARTALMARLTGRWKRAEWLAVALDPSAPPLSGQRGLLSHHLAAAVAELARQAHNLVLTGGETAGRVLDAADIDSLAPVKVVHHGAVISRATTGRLVAIRPGSFGDRTSLVQLLHAVHHTGYTASDIQENP